MSATGSADRRLSLACQRCRRRKTKCDFQTPRCSGCTKANVECVTTQRVHSSYRDPFPRGFVENLEAKLAGLERHANELQLHFPSDGVDERANSTANLFASQNNNSDNIMDVSNLVVPDTLISKESGAFNLARMTEGALIHTETSSVFHKSAGTDVDLSGIYLALSQSGKTRTWAEAYLKYVQKDLPFLDVTHIRDHLNANSINEIHPRSLAIHLMVLAIGALLPGLRGSETGHHAFVLFMSARKELGLTLQGDSLETLQFLLLLTLFSMLDPLGGDTWHLCGLSVRTAIVLGLHEEQYYNRTLSNPTSARQAFWTTYLIDRCVSFALDRPFGIDDGDISTACPEQAMDGGTFHTLARLALLTSKRRSHGSQITSTLEEEMVDLRNSICHGNNDLDLSFAHLFAYHISIWSLGPPFTSSLTSTLHTARECVKEYVTLITFYAQRGFILPWIVGWSLLHATILEEFIGTLLSPNGTGSLQHPSRIITEMVLGSLGRTYESMEHLQDVVQTLSRSDKSGSIARNLDNASTSKLLKSLYAMLELA